MKLWEEAFSFMFSSKSAKREHGTDHRENEYDQISGEEVNGLRSYEQMYVQNQRFPEIHTPSQGSYQGYARFIRIPLEPGIFSDAIAKTLIYGDAFAWCLEPIKVKNRSTSSWGVNSSVKLRSKNWQLGSNENQRRLEISHRIVISAHDIIRLHLCLWARYFD